MAGVPMTTFISFFLPYSQFIYYFLWEPPLASAVPSDVTMPCLSNDSDFSS